MSTVCAKTISKRKIRTILYLGAALLMALTIWAPGAGAFPTVATCVGCHAIWTGGGGVGHTGHNGLGLTGSCNACHAAIGDTPPTTRCGGCHVDLGLANHHQNAGTASCVGCHPGTPAPENTAVPGYATITAALDPCNGSEERFASLTVSLDNDGDLLTDGADPDCAPPTESDCNDGIDNDSDGMIDCADQDCSADPSCQAPEVEVACTDGIDNDNDGMIDCADPDCAADPACVLPGDEICTDGLDNDGDGMIDCADSDCAANPACQPPGDEICTDDLDNDGDGRIDCADPDCVADPACVPPTNEICTDNIDNDGDGMIDCADQDCATHPACQAPVMEDCDDRIDNDGDGFIDCKDPDCCRDPACRKTESCPQFNPPPSHTKLEEDDGCKASHAPGYEKPFTNGCTTCHGSKLTGPTSGGTAPSCFTCHGKEWDENWHDDSGNAPPDHTKKKGNAFHKPGLKEPFVNDCTSCHGQDLTGGSGPSCLSCHGIKWKDVGRFTPPADHTVKRGDNFHKTGLKNPFSTGCTDCHGSQLTGAASGGFAPSCFLCHKPKWKDADHDGSDDHDDDRNKRKHTGTWGRWGGGND